MGHVELRGRQVLYGEAGDGPPVLFLHGWGLHPRAYQHALVRLAAVPVHVISPALPGFGGTAALGGSEWSLAGFGAWVAEFLDAAGITDRALVMGHSFGGGVAIAFARDHPDRVRGLVLIDSISASAWARRGVTSRTMAERPLWDWGVWFPGDLWPLGQARRVIPAVLGEAVGNLVRDPWSVVKAADLARRADLRRELEELKGRLPVVVLWGTRDRVITRDAFEEMCELLGRPQAVTVEGVARLAHRRSRRFRTGHHERGGYRGGSAFAPTAPVEPTRAGGRTDGAPRPGRPNFLLVRLGARQRPVIHDFFTLLPTGS